MEIIKTVDVCINDFLDQAQEESAFSKMNLIMLVLRVIDFDTDDLDQLSKHRQKKYIIEYLEKILKDLKTV